MMRTDNTKPPRVFISYSWDSEGHKNWIANLATRLRSEGIDVILDQWEVRLGDQLPQFMERAVRESDFVCIICSPGYKERSNTRRGGVGYEGHLITAEVFNSQNERKFIPVLRSGPWDQAAPSWLLGKYYCDLSGEPYQESAYQTLTDTVHGLMELPPPLGSRPVKHLPVKAPLRIAVFMLAAAILAAGLWWLYRYSQSRTPTVPPGPTPNVSVPLSKGERLSVPRTVAVSEPYPWVDVKTSAWLMLRVRDYPPKEKTRLGAMGLSTLFNLQVMVTSPVAVIPKLDAWHSCIIVQRQFPEWNNGNGVRPLALVPYDGDSAIFDAQMTARNGSWRAVVVLNRNGTYDEWTTGSFTSDAGPRMMSLRETRLGSEPPNTREGGSKLEMTRELLIAHGVPIVQLTKDQLDSKCKSGSIYTQNVIKGKFRTFLE